jgi:hypothetical protein
MLSDFAVPESVGFVGAPCRTAFDVSDFLAASATISINSSRVLGFFASVSDICCRLCAFCVLSGI